MREAPWGRFREEARGSKLVSDRDLSVHRQKQEIDEPIYTVQPIIFDASFAGSKKVSQTKERKARIFRFPRSDKARLHLVNSREVRRFPPEQSRHFVRPSRGQDLWL